jgi:hypothetical protein
MCHTSQGMWLPDDIYACLCLEIDECGRAWMPLVCSFIVCGRIILRQRRFVLDVVSCFSAWWTSNSSCMHAPSVACGSNAYLNFPFSVYQSPPWRRTPVQQVQDKPGFEIHCDNKVSWCAPYCQIKCYPILFMYVILCPPLVYLMTSFYIAEFSHYYQIKSVAFEAFQAR